MTEYLIPTTVEQALQMLAAHPGEALLVAGGTDVIPDMRKGRRDPAFLIDITRIPELVGVQVQDGRVTVGAATTFGDLGSHPFLKQHVHALVEAAGSVGAQGIRNTATWAGNIVQAMPAADGAVVALALEAEACVLKQGATEWVPVESLFLGPGQSTIDPTSQLISAIRFQLPAGQWGTAWCRLGRRPSLVLPILNCAVKLTLRQDAIRSAVVALGPVAPCPMRARETEAFLVGRPAGKSTFAEAGQIARNESNPRSSIMRASREYRLSIIPVLVRDALAKATERARHVGMQEFFR